MTKSTNLTRRAVLQAAAIVPLASIRGTAANSALRVGLIGCGGRGTRVTKLLVEHTGAKVVALCDLFDDRIERARQVVPATEARAYRDLRELLASKLDAVIIATPVYLHPAHLEAAVAAGKHVYIEKPAAADVEGCKKVIQVSSSAPPHLNISFGFQQRYGTCSRTAKKRIDEGAIGQLRMALSYWLKHQIPPGPREASRPSNELERARQWKLWRETFGGIVVETYCHGVDVLNWFLGGHPVKATGCGGRLVEAPGDRLDHCDIGFTYESGVQGMLVGAMLAAPGYRDVKEQFFGSTGTVETSRLYWKHIRGKRDEVREEEGHDVTIDALLEFVHRVQSGKPENTGVRSAESTLTAILGQLAIDKRREVTWDEMMAG